MILLSLYLCFLAARQISRRKRRKTIVFVQPEKTPAQIQKELKQAKKAQAQIEQAEIDIGHYTEICTLLEEELQSAQKQLDKAREKVNQDKIFELATNGKILEKHERDLQKARRNVITIDSKYHAAQSKLEKAKRIIDSARKQ